MSLADEVKMPRRMLTERDCQYIDALGVMFGAEVILGQVEGDQCQNEMIASDAVRTERLYLAFGRRQGMIGDRGRHVCG